MRGLDILRSELHSYQGGAPHTLAVYRVVDVVVVVVVEAGVQAVGGGLAAVLCPAPQLPAQLSQARQIKLQTRPTEIKNKLSGPEKSGTENQKI